MRKINLEIQLQIHPIWRRFDTIRYCKRIGKFASVQRCWTMTHQVIMGHFLKYSANSCSMTTVKICRVRNSIPICFNITNVIINCWNSKWEKRCYYSVSHPLFHHLSHGTLESFFPWKQNRSLTFLVVNHFKTNKSFHRLLKSVWTIIIFKQLDYLKIKQIL